MILDGQTLTSDENNIVTLTLRYLHIKANLKNVATTVSEFGGFEDFGLESFTAEALNDASDYYIVTAVYKALDQTLKDGDVADEYGRVESMDYDFSEEPLEAHPNIKEIARKYGGVPRPDGTFDFPAKKPDSASGDNTSGLEAFDGAGSEVNPLYGMKTYPALQARYNKSFGTKEGWKKYVTSIAKITDDLPDSSLDQSLDKGGRNWLQLPPKIQKEGKVYRVSVDYLLSAPGKRWPQDVFENLT